MYSPFDFELFCDMPASAWKCRRYIAISAVTHQYGNSKVSAWALERAFAMLETSTRIFDPDVLLLERLFARARLWSQDLPTWTSLVGRARNVWRDAMYLGVGSASGDEISVDAIDVLHAAKRTEDEYLIGHAYFYVLARGAAYIDENAARLERDDRLRLMCGERALNAPLKIDPPMSRADREAAQQAKPVSIRVQVWSISDESAMSPPSSARCRPAAATPSLGGRGWKPRYLQRTESLKKDLGGHFARAAANESESLPVFEPSACISPPPSGPKVEPKVEWTPRVHKKIAGREDELWAMFTSEPWPLG